MDQMPGQFPPPPEAGPPPPYGYPAPSGPYPLDLSRVLQLTLSLFRYRWRTFVAIALIVMVPAWVVASGATLLTSDSADWYAQLASYVRGESTDLSILTGRVLQQLLVNVVVSVVVAVAGLVATGALATSTAEIYSGGQTATVTSLRRSLSRLGTYLGIYAVEFATQVAIISIGILAGAALFLATSSDGRIVPGPFVFLGLIVFVATFAVLLFFGIRWSLAAPAAVLDSLGAIDALKRSWSLVSGSSWRVLGYLIVFGLLVGVVGGLISAVFTFVISPIRVTSLTTYEIDPIRLAFSTFVSGIIAAALTPIVAIAMTLLYFDLRFRRGEQVPQPGSQESPTP